MVDAGISSGDTLIVDRAVEVSDGKIIVAVLNGEFTVKRIKKRRGQLFLMPENPDYACHRLALREGCIASVCCRFCA